MAAHDSGCQPRDFISAPAAPVSFGRAFICVRGDSDLVLVPELLRRAQENFSCDSNKSLTKKHSNPRIPRGMPRLVYNGTAQARSSEAAGSAIEIGRASCRERV